MTDPQFDGLAADTKLNIRKVSVMIDEFPDIGQRVEIKVKGYVVKHGMERLEAKGTRPFVTVDADEIMVVAITNGPMEADNREFDL